jgi:FKBP-type peptidyl-prolyl cis-trans isomerase (trigger factor)
METAKFFEGFVESIEGLQVLSLLLSSLAFASTKVQILTPEEVLLLQAGDEAAVPVTFPSNHKVPQMRGRKAVSSTKATSTSMYVCPGTAVCVLRLLSVRSYYLILQVAELRGVEAIFDVTIKGLKDTTFPALDDDFAKKIGAAESLADLKTKIRESISQESAVSTSKNINKALEDEIVKLVDVDIPETLIDEQTKTKFANMMSDFKAKGMDDAQVKNMITKENFEKYKKTSYNNTVRSLRISFVIGEIAKKEGIKVDAAELESEMANIRQQYAGEEIDEEQARSRVEAELERKKVLEFLKNANTVKLIPKKAAAP